MVYFVTEMLYYSVPLQGILKTNRDMKKFDAVVISSIYFQIKKTSKKL